MKWMRTGFSRAGEKHRTRGFSNENAPRIVDPADLDGRRVVGAVHPVSARAAVVVKADRRKKRRFMAELGRGCRWVELDS